MKRRTIRKYKNINEYSHDDEFSIVNINMSHLLSLSNSNSKKASDKDNNNSKEINKKNNFSGSSSNKVKGEVSSGNGSIESNNANITNSISNNTNSNSNSLNNNNDRRSKDSITAKRKKYYDKLIRKKLSTNTCKLGGKFINQDYFKNKIEFDSLKNNQSTSSNIKITNNTKL